MNQRMIRSSLFSLTGLLFVFLVMIGCSSTVRNLSSSFRQQGIAVDSSLNDWTNLLNYDSRSKLYYGVTHDPQYLYVAMQTKDPVVQRKIMAFGLTLWLDTSAKKKKGKGIHHLAFRVEDIEAALEELKDKGVELIDEIPRLGAGGARIAFIHPRSTGGVLVELCETEAKKK